MAPYASEDASCRGVPHRGAVGRKVQQSSRRPHLSTSLLLFAFLGALGLLGFLANSFLLASRSVRGGVDDKRSLSIVWPPTPLPQPRTMAGHSATVKGMLTEIRTAMAEKARIRATTVNNASVTNEVSPGPEGNYSYAADPMVRHKMVDQGDLKQLLSTMKPGLPVVGTIANMAFKEMLFNWIKHVLRANMTNVLVASLNPEVHQVAAEMGVSSILLSSKVKQEDFRRDPEAFKHMGTLKTAFILSIVELGWDVLMSDTDVAWLRNPVNITSVHGEMGATDLLVTTDSVSHSNDIASMQADPTVKVNQDVQGWFRFATDRAKEIFGNVYEHAFNTGVLYLRATPETLTFCIEWHDVMRTRGKSRDWPLVWGDQHALNQLMRIKMFPIQVVKHADGRPRHNRIFWTFNFTIRLGVLPPAEFCNGHMYFVQRIPQKLGLQPYVVHNTFQFYYGDGKTARFREHGLWLLDPDEFYTSGNFVSFDVKTPEWVYGIPEGIERHKAAFAYYHEALQNAYAIADILDRYLILPKVTCFCDRWWDKLTPPCRAPGGDVDPPFVCPIDHFINPYFWGRDARSIRWRQSTFLENPRVSPEILNSRLTVGIKNPSDGTGEGALHSQVMLPSNATDVEVREILGGLKSTRVLHFADAKNAFCRFYNQTDNYAFEKHTTRYFYLEWCCLPDGANQVLSVPTLSQRTLEGCGRPLQLQTAAVAAQ